MYWVQIANKSHFCDEGQLIKYGEDEWVITAILKAKLMDKTQIFVVRRLRL